MKYLPATFAIQKYMAGFGFWVSNLRRLTSQLRGASGWRGPWRRPDFPAFVIRSFELDFLCDHLLRLSPPKEFASFHERVLELEKELRDVAILLREVGWNQDIDLLRERIREIREIEPLFESISEEWERTSDAVINDLRSKEERNGGLEKESELADSLFREAVKVVVDYKFASASLLQRRLNIGYAQATKLLDELEAHGVVGPNEEGKRKVLIKDPNLIPQT